MVDAVERAAEGGVTSEGLTKFGGVKPECGSGIVWIGISYGGRLEAIAFDASVWFGEGFAVGIEESEAVLSEAIEDFFADASVAFGEAIGGEAIGVAEFGGPDAGGAGMHGEAGAVEEVEELADHMKALERQGAEEKAAADD